MREKKCSKCKEIKVITQFFKDKTSSDGLGYWCKDCMIKKGKEQRDRNRKKNKNRIIYNNTKKKCSMCKEEKIRSKENWIKDITQTDGLYNCCKECVKIKNRIGILKNQYGLNLEDYNRMKELQNNRCKVCGEELEIFYVDHCHKTDKIRGLLCNACNVGLGYFRDNPLSLFKAIKYLRGKL